MMNKQLEYSYNFLQTLIQFRKECEDEGLDDLREVTNAMQFLVMANLDMTTLMNEIGNIESNSWNKILNSRMLALIIYGNFVDIPRILNFTFLIPSAKVIIDPSSKLKFTQYNKALARLKDKHFEFFGKIRNKTIAHKELDSVTQIDIISQVDSETIFYIACDVVLIGFPIIEECHNIYQNLLPK